MSYEFRTEPFEHQREVFENTAADRAYGLFWEQGTGKSKAIIDTAAYLWEQDEIDTLLVIAPNGVHRNRITDEIPVHWPRRHAKDIKMMYWESKKASGWKKHSTAKSKAWARGLRDFLDHDGLRILTMNYDAIMTPAGLAALERTLKGCQTLLVFDESHYIKAPGAKPRRLLLA